MNNIKKVREEKGLSQKEIAISLGVSAPTVSEWESGKKFPSTENLMGLSTLLETTTDYLLGRTDDPSPPNSDDDEDAEFWELREQLRTQPGMRTLFSASKNATKEDLLDAVRIIEALKGRSDDDFD